jgi:DNA-binding winged helix-turn-helix (wHTH) protein
MSSLQWRFADFRLDPDNACLWRGTQPIALTPKAFDVLHYLIIHPDRLVTKDTLLDAVWPETAISDAVVRIAIGELRRALGDTVQAPRFIATVHRRGYRFVAPVAEYTEEVPGPASPVPPAVPQTPLVVPAGAVAPPGARVRACPGVSMAILPRRGFASPALHRWRCGAPPAGRTTCLARHSVRRVRQRCPGWGSRQPRRHRTCRQCSPVPVWRTSQSLYRRRRRNAAASLCCFAI